MNYTRRDFLHSIINATLGAAGLSFLPPVVQSRSNDISEEYSALSPEAIILFQGDSITDANRNKEERGKNAGLGTGYAFLAAAHLRHLLADRNLAIYNRGISGNKVFQLSERWDKDCLQLRPNLVSILVGVNDYWHTLSSGYDGTVETFKKDYSSLLSRTLDALNDVQLVLGEPFVLTEGSAVTTEWFPAFTAYQEAVKEIAQEFDAALIPYQSIFDEASDTVSPTYWSADGVHPTIAGSQLMAQGWLETVKRL